MLIVHRFIFEKVYTMLHCEFMCEKPFMLQNSCASHAIDSLKVFTGKWCWMGLNGVENAHENCRSNNIHGPMNAALKSLQKAFSSYVWLVYEVVVFIGPLSNTFDHLTHSGSIPIQSSMQFSEKPKKRPKKPNCDQLHDAVRCYVFKQPPTNDFMIVVVSIGPNHLHNFI